MPIGTIIAGVSAAASIGGGLLQANAASKASKQQAASAQSAIDEQKQMFGVAENALNPYVNAGTSVLPTLKALETPGSSASTLSQLPGFQFQSQYGDLQATNQLAAQGLGGSGGPLGAALSQYNQGLAGTYYQNYTNALQQYANMGLGAGSALAGTATQTGQAIGQTQQAQGTALASGTLGQANALAGGLTSASSSATNALLLNKLLGQSGTSGIYGTTNAFAGAVPGVG